MVAVESLIAKKEQAVLVQAVPVALYGVGVVKHLLQFLKITPKK